MKIRVALRMMEIQRVLVRHGLDEFVRETHLWRPLRFVFLLSPWTWFERRKPAPRGERLRLALQELGPIFVKFGQAVSTRRDLLPLDIADELAKLQDAVPPFPGTEARGLIELKTDPRYPDRTVSPARLAEAVLAVVDATGTADRVMLESFDWRGPRHALRLRPGIRTAWLTSADTTREAALWWGGIPPSPSIPQAVAAAGLPHESVPSAPKGALARELATELPRELPRVLSRELPRELAAAPVADAPVWAPAWETLTRAAVAEAHALGLRVMPWTVNRRAAMRLLTGWGVDGLITDRPDVAWDVVGPETGVPHSVML